MKKLILSLLLMSSMTLNAQNEKYVQTMGSTLKAFGAATTAEELTALAAKFERIGDAEKTEWLPYYYAAMIKSRLSMMGAGDKDKVADEATAVINKAEAISKNNSEIFCVKSMIATAKMLVDPMNRWQQYGAESTRHLNAAKAADSTNPRPYVLEATGLKSTPENFGGGCKMAKPLAEKAITLFNSKSAENTIFPGWGRDIVEGIIKDCK